MDPVMKKAVDFLQKEISDNLEKFETLTGRSFRIPRLSGFTPWQKNEEYQLSKIIKEANNLQKGNAMDEKELSTIKAAILRAHLAPIARRTFGTRADAVIKFGFADGIFALGEDGSPGVLGEDDSILTSESAIVTELRRRYADLVAAVAPASTPAPGKTMASSEYNLKSTNPACAQELAKFFTEGGQIVPDSAEIE
jgi:hypothetical protein